MVVLRPGFVYGPRDRTVLPRIIENSAQAQDPLSRRRPGGDEHDLRAAISSRPFSWPLDNPSAVGQVFNLTDGEFVSKRRFIETICDALGLPTSRPRKPPLWLAKIVTWISEKKAGALPAPRRRRISLSPSSSSSAYNLDFSIEKAKRELGYQPRIHFDDGMAETMA